jgi:hypothetical protein
MSQPTTNAIVSIGYDRNGRQVLTSSISSSDIARDHDVMVAALELVGAHRRGVTITPEILWDHLIGGTRPQPRKTTQYYIIELFDQFGESCEFFYRGGLTTDPFYATRFNTRDDAQAVADTLNVAQDVFGGNNVWKLTQIEV